MEVPGAVVGIDAYSRGWVAVVLRPDGKPAAATHRSLAEVVTAYPDALSIGVDIPIGLPKDGVRAADAAARSFLTGGRSASVFDAPPRPVLAAATYAEARRVALAVWGRGVSAQSYRLGPRILEAEEVAATDGRLVEIHPEVSFAAMAGAPLADSKRSWNGQMTRRRLLRRAGITLLDRLAGAGSVPPDDVLDAAAVAWTAARFARGEAVSLPDPPQAGQGGRPMAIWY